MLFKPETPAETAIYSYIQDTICDTDGAISDDDEPDSLKSFLDAVR